jgi:GNAT superfamily N-acetyltransferase
MDYDQSQKITWELSLECRESFQDAESSGEAAARLEFRPVDPPCAAFNWFLFQAIGEQHRWGGRGDWDQAKWDELIGKETFETWVGYLQGTPVGYAELESQDDGSVRIVCFGLLPQFIGQGLGGVLLRRVVDRGWQMGANRVWLRTCNHDHPHARPNYEARGFRLIEETVAPPNPRLQPVVFTGGQSQQEPPLGS